MYVIVVTGTRSLKLGHQAVITRRVRTCVPPGMAPESVEFMSGGAVGVDTFWALEAQRLYPEARHTLVAPSAPWNEEGLRDAAFTERVQLTEGGYRGRNTYMVMRANQLDAFPLYPEYRQPRSGTWHAIRVGQRREALEMRIEILEVDPNNRRLR